MNCHSCGKSVTVEGKVGRSDSCPFCNADLKVCKNCSFYDARVYNECKEHGAERVVDKTRANFCEHFEPRETAPAAGGKSPEQLRIEALRQAAESLFKKK